MAKGRDDFHKPTVEMLAKRVAYFCSNPSCRQVTIGANEEPGKATIIGIAAHITAASEGGPRYDPTLTNEQRRHFDNGIWLCSNCATLIDKDTKRFTKGILVEWKQDAEDEARRRLSGELKKLPLGSPFIEVDLVSTSYARWNMGYSDKNPIEWHEGQRVIVVGNEPIIHWGLRWHFNFIIYNNSMYPAYNLIIESIGEMHFSRLDTLKRKNNLPPLEKLDLTADLEGYIEGIYHEADRDLESGMPEHLSKLLVKISYQDDSRNTHTSYVRIENGLAATTKA